jgi:hypothetical protein
MVPIPFLFYLIFCLFTSGSFIISSSYYGISSYKISGITTILFCLFTFGLAAGTRDNIDKITEATDIPVNEGLSILVNELVCVFSVVMAFSFILTIWYLLPDKI